MVKLLGKEIKPVPVAKYLGVIIDSSAKISAVHISDPFGESLIFCPKLALGRLFSKIIFKSSNDFVYLGNLRKIKSAVKMRSKCSFLVVQKVRL